MPSRRASPRPRASWPAATPRRPATRSRPAASRASPGSRPTSACPPTPRRPSAGQAGFLDQRPEEPAVAAGDRQPALAGPLRHGPGRDAERLRLQRRAAVAPRAARLAGLASSSRSGWSLKAMHRLIVTRPPTARRRDLTPPRCKVDAGNRLLWRKAPMRLEAEMVRDAMLAVSGALERAPGRPELRRVLASTRPPGRRRSCTPPIQQVGPGSTAGRSTAPGPAAAAAACSTPSTAPTPRPPPPAAP